MRYILLVLLVWLNNGLLQATPKKHALLIGLSTYAQETEWSSLHAYNDIALMQHTLLRQGFAPANIAVLENDAATRAGILMAIETNLINVVGKGDIVLFHFSGHGQQVLDALSKKKDELDRLDEALVPYDSPLHFKKGVYEGDRLIKDEELGKLLKRLRKKLGREGQLIVILDACHSGTGTRGLINARGTDIVMGAKAEVNNLKYSTFDFDFLKGNIIRNKKKLAPMIAFFGSAAGQLNYETRNEEGEILGSLTYAFCKALNECKKGTSFRTLFEKIQLEMTVLAPKQDPQVEGALDMTLFKNEYLGKAEYFKIKENGWFDEKEILLEGGTLVGLHPGTELAFYPADTRNTDQTQPLATGTVTSSTLLGATVKLEQVLAEQTAYASWCFITKRAFPPLQLSLQMDVPDADLLKAMKQQLNEYPVIQEQENNAELLLELVDSAGFKKIQLITADEFLIFEEKIEHAYHIHAFHTLEAILKYVQSKFLRNLEMQNQAIDLRFEFIRDVRLASRGAKVKDNSFREGESFKIKIKNYGSKKAYFNVIDIQPNNEVNALIPIVESDYTIQELFLNPKDSLIFDVEFDVGPPYGTDVIKLIATTKPLDLGAVTNSRGQDRSRTNPIEQLLASTFLLQLRGQKPTTLSIGTMIHVDSKVIEILPPITN